MSGVYSNIFDFIQYNLAELPAEYIRENSPLESPGEVLDKELVDDLTANDLAGEKNNKVSNTAEKDNETEEKDNEVEEEDNEVEEGVDKETTSAQQAAANLANIVMERRPVLAHTSLFHYYVRNGYKLFTHDRTITNQKIWYFREFIENIGSFSKDLPTATILAPKQSLGGNPKKIEIREEEINELKKKISIILAYAENTKVKLGLAREGKKPAGTAESRIEVIIEMLQWLMSEEVIHVLHLVFGKENKAKNAQSTTLYKLSADINVDVFKWVFYIKLHEIKIKHGVISKREIDPMVAQSLLKEFLCSITTLHTSLHQPFASIRDEACNSEEKLEWQKQIIDQLVQYVKTEKKLLSENNIFAQNHYVSYVFDPSFLQKVAKSLDEYSENLFTMSKEMTLAISESKLSGKITRSKLKA